MSYINSALTGLELGKTLLPAVALNGQMPQFSLLSELTAQYFLANKTNHTSNTVTRPISVSNIDLSASCGWAS